MFAWSKAALSDLRLGPRHDQRGQSPSDCGRPCGAPSITKDQHFEHKLTAKHKVDDKIADRQVEVGHLVGQGARESSSCDRLPGRKHRGLGLLTCFYLSSVSILSLV